jgi:sugar/nucleoside kinase (ribokinase family)
MQLSSAERGVVFFLGDAFVDVQTSQVQSLPAWGEDRDVASISTFAGGSVCNAARRFAALQCSMGLKRPYLSIAIADDTFGNMFASILEKEGFVDTSCVNVIKNEHQAVCIVITGGADRAFVSCNSSNKFLTPSLIQRNIDGVAHQGGALKHLHIGGYYCCKNLQTPGLETMLRGLKERHGNGLKISLDTNFDATKRWDGNQCIQNILPYVDIVLPNETEVCGICEAVCSEKAGNDPIVALNLLTKSFPRCLVVVTLGKDGAVAGKGEERWRFEGIALETVVDPTGAGDSFTAAFLHEFLLQEGNGPVDIERCLKIGCIAGTLCVQQHGACSQHFTYQDLLESFAKIKGHR